MRKKQNIDVILNIISPIFFGFLTYFFSKELTIHEIALHELADGLWAYALMSAILVIWRRKINIFWIILVFIFFVFFEFLQYLKFIRGTGDYVDVLIYFSFGAIAIILNKYFFNIFKYQP